MLQRSFCWRIGVRRPARHLIKQAVRFTPCVRAQSCQIPSFSGNLQLIASAAPTSACPLSSQSWFLPIHRPLHADPSPRYRWDFPAARFCPLLTVTTAWRFCSRSLTPLQALLHIDVIPGNSPLPPPPLSLRPPPSIILNVTGPLPLQGDPVHAAGRRAGAAALCPAGARGAAGACGGQGGGGPQ